ncbi:MAG: hypothetical protein QNK36_10510 [Colwellia sp.]|nr:hypothetical protein [Colwellia sp.]
MSLSKVQVISNAIAILGHSPIVNLDEGDDLVVAAEQAYDMLLPSVLSQSNWRFAVQIQQLSLLVETLPTEVPWKYVYALPADFIKTIRVIPQSYDWEIFQNKRIYSNVTGPFFMEYVFQPSESLVPLYFWHYFTHEVAGYLSLSNAQKPEFYNAIESKRTLLLSMAAAADAQNRPQSSQVDFPMLSSRAIAGLNSNFS